MEQIIKIGTCLPGWMAEKALGAAIDAGKPSMPIF